MNSRNWKVLAPLALIAAGALAAGIAALAKKPQETAAAPTAAKGKAKAPAAPAPGMLKTGTYSFISGFNDAATVELTLRYNAETCSFAVVSEDFLSCSSASHVAVIEGEEFSAQIEYAPYYAGEDFAAYAKGIEQKFGGYGTARFAGLEGIRYRDGDSICLCFPIPGDEHSFVQVILFKRKDDDDPLEALPDSPDVKAMLDSIQIAVKR